MPEIKYVWIVHRTIPDNPRICRYVVSKTTQHFVEVLEWGKKVRYKKHDDHTVAFDKEDDALDFYKTMLKLEIEKLQNRTNKAQRLYDEPRITVQEHVRPAVLDGPIRLD